MKSLNAFSFLPKWPEGESINKKTLSDIICNICKFKFAPSFECDHFCGDCKNQLAMSPMERV